MNAVGIFAGRGDVLVAMALALVIAAMDACVTIEDAAFAAAGVVGARSVRPGQLVQPGDRKSVV